MSESKDIERQMQALIEYSLSECLKNAVAYGIFALDIEIPQEIKDSSFFNDISTEENYWTTLKLSMAH